MEKIVGKSAPPEFLRMVRKLAACHSTAMGGGVGFLRAYHVGQVCWWQVLCRALLSCNDARGGWS